MKKLSINNELLQILNKIKMENKTISEWREIESSDMFQSENFCGGFDATEDKFLFSYYDSVSQENWFEFSLEDLNQLINNKKQLELRKPDR